MWDLIWAWMIRLGLVLADGFPGDFFTHAGGFLAHQERCWRGARG